MMRACIVTPAPAGARNGNRVTALRWAKILRQLGWTVRVSQTDDGQPAELLLAVHAVKSFEAIATFVRRAPHGRLVVAVAGTDLYETGTPAQRAAMAQALRWAGRVVVLQPAAQDDLPAAVHDKVRVIYQSCSPPAPRPSPRTDAFEVVVVGHLRAIKDPLLCAAAARRLPAASRVAVVQIGAALDPQWAARAQAEARDNPRYHWRGPLGRQATLQAIAAARLLVVTSHAEGGANVVSEAIVCGTPVLSTRIAGSVGILGADHPGLFDVGDVQGLAALMARAEAECEFWTELAAAGQRVQPNFTPARERAAWAALLAERFD